MPLVPCPSRPVSRAALALPVLGVACLLASCGADAGDPGTPTLGSTSGPTAPTETPVPSATTSTLPPGATSAATPGTTTGAPQDLTADLTVTVDDGQGQATTYELTCSGPTDGTATGTAPDPAAACQAVADAGGVEAFAPPAADVVCTEQYGGPQTATISGTVNGEPVSADLSRTDGCEISRWDALVPLVPSPDA